MLFDEMDMRVFDNVDSRAYFEEILQSYYCKNYRASVVLLYSFVIYDLFIKLQSMAAEGDRKAKKMLDEINQMISDDEKYSKVENEIIEFFIKNCGMYFNRFTEDIQYLKNCRNKCAHLKVNDNSLYIPNDYHARMLICSMYDNVLSVKAPFIMDLFSIARVDVEKYAEIISFIPENGLDEGIKKSIVEKYLKRMTYDSLMKSYKTFIRLLFVSEDEECIKNVYGLYAFVFALTDYLVKNGYSSILKDETILNVFSKIEQDVLKDNSVRVNALIAIITTYPIVMDILRENKDVFEYISNRVLTNPQGLCYYKSFYPREAKTVYEFFIGNSDLHRPLSIGLLFETLKDCEDFDFVYFLTIMINSIPVFNGFNSADSFMSFFLEHLSELSLDDINKVMDLYNKNNQCYKRSRHDEDISRIKEWIEQYKE